MEAFYRITEPFTPCNMPIRNQTKKKTPDKYWPNQLLLCLF